MDPTLHWKVTAVKEIQHAQASRQAGNEGRARVCARRAAGAIVTEYFRRNQIKVSTSSVYSLLQTLQSHPALEPEVARIVTHMLARVTPEHKLPEEADLIAEVQTLALKLLGETL